jgi:hypothetical protein
MTSTTHAETSTTHAETSEIARKFWVMVMECRDEIEEKLMERSAYRYQQVNDIIDKIKVKLGISNAPFAEQTSSQQHAPFAEQTSRQVGIYFGIDVRNGMKLSERKNSIEIIISPMLCRKNKQLTHCIFDAYHAHIKAHNIQTKYTWSVAKYKFWQPASLQSISINYKKPAIANTESDLLEITQSDFSYFPILDSSKEKPSKLDIILFINDDVAKYLIKKEEMTINNKKRNIWIPINSSIYAILDSAIGEYSLLNILDKMEIYLKSEHEDINRHPLDHLTKIIQMINNNPLNDVHTCARCEYANTQMTMKKCICKKVFYCDAICQKANRAIHKLSCTNFS